MRPIYLDHAAATPIRPEVSAAMADVENRFTGNPSAQHVWGRKARAMLEEARERTAVALHSESRRVHFVHGGTESINLAILGRVDWAGAQDIHAPGLLHSAVEHSAVRESMAAAALLGSIVEVMPVLPTGEVSLPGRQELHSKETYLVSIQWVNQETGLVLPIAKLAELCREAGVPLHVDGVQAAGKVPIRLDSIPVALLSLSGHKLGGPRSTGVLVVADGVEIRPRLFGGGQEQDLRPGTEDVAGAVGFAVALERSVETLAEEEKRLTGLRDRLEAGLSDALPGLKIHSAEGTRAPHISNVGFPGLPRDVLPGALDLEGIGVSAGSACATGSVLVSPVLRALYGAEAERFAPLRLSLGWSSTEDDVEEALRRIPPIVQRMEAV